MAQVRGYPPRIFLMVPHPAWRFVKYLQQLQAVFLLYCGGLIILKRFRHRPRGRLEVPPVNPIAHRPHTGQGGRPSGMTPEGRVVTGRPRQGDIYRNRGVRRWRRFERRQHGDGREGVFVARKFDAIPARGQVARVNETVAF